MSMRLPMGMGVFMGMRVLVGVLMRRLEGLAAEAVLGITGDPQGSALAPGLRQAPGCLFPAPSSSLEFVLGGFLAGRVRAGVVVRLMA